MQSTRDDGLIDADQAAARCRVRPKTIHQWVARGHLAKAGTDTRYANGRRYTISLFDPAEVQRAELKLRKPARRIILPRAA